MPAWMKDLNDIMIYGDQKSTYNLYHLGEPVDSLRQPMLVTFDLGEAAKFATYIESTNTLKVGGVTQGRGAHHMGERVYSGVASIL